MIVSFITLKAGDFRRRGDEVRHLDIRSQYEGGPPKKGRWEEVSMFGHKILASDLMVAEFRRSRI